MTTRLSLFVWRPLVVIALALLASACAGASSPTAPSAPPVVSNPPAPPSNPVPVVTPANGAVLREGDTFGAEYTYDCEVGAWRGLLYVRNDGAFLAPSLYLCAGGFSASFNGVVNEWLLDFAKGYELTVVIAVATNPNEFKAGNFTSRSDIATWKIE